MKYDHNKHDIELFACDLNVLGKIRMSDYQVLEHFKKVLSLNIEAHLLEIDDIDVAIRGERVLFKSKLPQSTTSSMLGHMTDRNEDTKHTEQHKRPKNQTHFMKHFARLE